MTSHGPSGIGFVNFGALGRLDIQAPLATHGAGSRGFNAAYDGSRGSARFSASRPTGTAPWASGSART